jgi:hypothetical protein
MVLEPDGVLVLGTINDLCTKVQLSQAAALPYSRGRAGNETEMRITDVPDSDGE